MQFENLNKIGEISVYRKYHSCNLDIFLSAYGYFGSKLGCALVQQANSGTDWTTGTLGKYSGRLLTFVMSALYFLRASHLYSVKEA